MRRDRKLKMLFLMALVLSVTAMTLGFAAFSTTLNISSSASVTPSSDDFKVVLCYAGGLRDCNTSDGEFIDWYIDSLVYNGAQASLNAFVSGSVAGSLDAIFTKPGQAVEYIFYAQNIGEYDAYLRGVTYSALDNGSYKKCSANTKDGSNATDSLVQAACNGIKATISIGGVEYNLGDESISGHKLSKNTSEEIVFKIEYVDGSAYADGSFDVQLSKFKLVYSTVDGAGKLISFTIGGVSYQAEEGMTWAEWIDSDYNVDGFYENTYIYSSDDQYVRYDCDAVSGTREILENEVYRIGSACGHAPTEPI